MTNPIDLKKYSVIKTFARSFFQEYKMQGLLDTTADQAVKDLMKLLVSENSIEEFYDRIGRPNNLFKLRT